MPTNRIGGSVLSALIFAAVLAQSAIADDAIPARIADTAQRATAEGVYPAMVIAMVDNGHTQIRGFGKLPDGNVPDPHTVFEIGSVTKTFTALLLASSVQSKALTLDTPVAQLLPDFHIPARNGKVITLGLLAEQFSGLPRMPGNFAAANPADPYVDYDMAKLKAFLVDYTLPRDPGQSYEYSNLGFGLLGNALAAREHMPYAALLERDVFKPLGMTSSSADAPPALLQRLAPGHSEIGLPATHWHLGVFAGAGAIVSDGADMTRYLQANMGLLKSPLEPAMTLAHKPDRQISGDVRIGLAWMTRHLPSGDIIWHNGETGGYVSFVGFTADGRRGVVILTNIAKSVDELGFAALASELPVPEVNKAVAVSEQALLDYEGQYVLKPGFVLNVFHQGNQLFARATGQQPIPFFAKAKDSFFANAADIAIRFDRDAEGKVSGLMLHQAGLDHPAKRANQILGPDGLTATTLSSKALQGYPGRYGQGGAFVVTYRDGQLYAKLGEQPSFQIYASAADHFFYTVVDARIDFERGTDGKVKALVLHQNGQDHRAERQP